MDGHLFYNNRIKVINIFILFPDSYPMVYFGGIKKMIIGFNNLIFSTLFFSIVR